MSNFRRSYSIGGGFWQISAVVIAIGIIAKISRYPQPLEGHGNRGTQYSLYVITYMVITAK